MQQKVSKLLSLLLPALIVVGCATSPSTDPLAPDKSMSPDKPITPSQPTVLMGDTSADSRALGHGRWYQACFRMPMNDDGEADFTTDYILADKVVSPVLRQHISRLPLWRFHRRSASDKSGHQFSFIYYTDEATHKEISRAFTDNPVLAHLIDEQHVLRLIPQCRGGKNRHKINAASDPHWDPLLQNAWPYFIMGVSATWLNLIQQADLIITAGEDNTETGNSDSDVTINNNEDSDLYAHYEKIELKVIESWQEYGQHAYFHHLSALFGYEPVKFRKWIKF
ncbi:hypothetical protein [Hahella ganghwensis]|uniref:hypothetical protein n=1 Tax=Hahella ganghwensis TaxID=286420 RepID=UPI0003A3CCC1|nr:hypothetical protein [Hahella ganghwensis]